MQVLKWTKRVGAARLSVAFVRHSAEKHRDSSIAAGITTGIFYHEETYRAYAYVPRILRKTTTIN